MNPKHESELHMSASAGKRTPANVNLIHTNGANICIVIIILRHIHIHIHLYSLRVKKIRCMNDKLVRQDES